MAHVVSVMSTVSHDRCHASGHIALGLSEVPFVMTSLSNDAVLDHQGRIMFLCPACGAPISRSDLFELGLRFPEPGESKDDYCEAELIDSVTHVACLKSGRAAG